ncbi:hypothetical protein GCM10011405_36420 [Rufibacter glacialis]|nr:hypothetical protein GCM10011405_36420 [Rufibacter glacialis]
MKDMGISEDRIDVSSASSSSSSGSDYGSGSTSSSSSSTGYGSGTSSSGGSSSSRDKDDNDGIGGFFRSLFSDDDDSATTYSNVARHSDCIVTVHAQTDEEARRAATILDQYGSVDVDQRAEQYGYRSSSTGSGTLGSGAFAGSAMGSGTMGNDITGSDSDRSNSSLTGTGADSTFSGGTDNTYAGSTTNTSLSDSTSSLTGGTSDTTRSDLTDSTSIPIIEENLQVGKREIETGGARLRSRIVERPVEEHLRLRSEHVRVERHAVDRPATEADFNGFREGEIELTEHAEVPVVNKEARVVEEISLGKEVEERDEVIRDTVRSTEVDIDDLHSDASRNRLNNDLDSDVNRDRTGLDPDRDRDRDNLNNDRNNLNNDRNPLL